MFPAENEILLRRWNMVDEKIVTKIREMMKKPEFWLRIEEAQKRAQETIEYLRKAAELPPGWRDWIVTI